MVSGSQVEVTSEWFRVWFPEGRYLRFDTLRCVLSAGSDARFRLTPSSDFRLSAGTVSGYQLAETCYWYLLPFPDTKEL